MRESRATQGREESPEQPVTSPLSAVPGYNKKEPMDLLLRFVRDPLGQGEEGRGARIGNLPVRTLRSYERGLGP